MQLNCSDLARFWAKVEKSPDPDGCWVWRGTRTADGYGRFRLNHTPGEVRAHRLSWEIHFGPIPDGMYVCHRCDNRACIRPDHFFLGTAVDNWLDCLSKGRHSVGTRHSLSLPAGHAQGSRNGRAVFTEDDVREIRRQFVAGVSKRRLARENGVSRPTITAIVTRKHWSHVPD